MASWAAVIGRRGHMDGGETVNAPRKRVREPCRWAAPSTAMLTAGRRELGVGRRVTCGMSACPGPFDDGSPEMGRGWLPVVGSTPMTVVRGGVREMLSETPAEEAIAGRFRRKKQENDFASSLAVDWWLFAARLSASLAIGGRASASGRFPLRGRAATAQPQLAL